MHAWLTSQTCWTAPNLDLPATALSLLLCDHARHSHCPHHHHHRLCCSWQEHPLRRLPATPCSNCAMHAAQQPGTTKSPGLSLHHGNRHSNVAAGRTPTNQMRRGQAHDLWKDATQTPLEQASISAQPQDSKQPVAASHAKAVARILGLVNVQDGAHDGLPGGDLQKDNDKERHHGQAAVPHLGALGPPPLPQHHGRRQRAALAVVRLQQRLQVTHGHKGVGGRGHAADVRQRLDHRVRQVVDEQVVGVERGHAPPELDAALLRQLAVLHVNLLQRLNVLRHE
mmetsp:Transcript_25901/g.65914  ORF Transcript_25901/g.65914 Transcript_25901/m.65914 type:complete len:283 (+) Transcript_25901:351-1199(+)